MPKVRISFSKAQNAFVNKFHMQYGTFVAAVILFDL